MLVALTNTAGPRGAFVANQRLPFSVHGLSGNVMTGGPYLVIFVCTLDASAKRTPAQKDSFLAQRSAFMITPLSAADCSVLRPISAMAMYPEGADTWAKSSHAFAAFVEDQPVEAVG